jgi:DivIVA domain-containing protein
MAAESTRPGPGGSSLSPDLVAHRGFATARRGFAPGEVRAFLAQVADELRSGRQREAALDQARHEAEERAAHPTFDERTLITAVGEETASILGSARAAAADIRAKAEDSAARILKEAHDRVSAMRAEAETVLSRRTAEAEAAAGRITEAATADAERLRDAARREAADIRAKAEADRTSMVNAAQGARDRILGDLTRRRKITMVQIQQLRAGRDRLLDAYKTVRLTLDGVTAELQRADAEARAAAEAAGRRPPVSDDEEGVVVLDALGAIDSPGSHPADHEESGDVPSAGAAAVDLGDRPAGTGGATGREPARAPATPTQVAEPRRATTGGPQRRPNDTGPPDPQRHLATVAGAVPASGPAASTAAGVVAAGLVPTEAADDDQAGEGIEAPAPGGDDRSAGPDGDRPLSAEDEAYLQRRDAALDDIDSGLARRLKRALQDDQNDLLDRLRGLEALPAAAGLLSDLPVQMERYAAAGRPLLADAFRAGASFATSFRSPGPGAFGADPVDADDTAAALATDLATAVVVPLRRRLEQALADAGEEDPGVLAGALGGAYRDWKTERIERAAADQVATAFARGAYEATPDDTVLRWLVDDVEGPCPDCDDNALAGGVPKGEPFPTGQRWPPAHAGCRCVLVPEP